MKASEVVALLNLKPHPEGGFYSETFRDFSVVELNADGTTKQTILGSDIEAGHKLQYTVPPNIWFGSYPTLDIDTSSSDGESVVKAPKRDGEYHYSLVGCTCAPAFQFEDFELAKRSELISSAPNAEAWISYLTHPE
ncbi:hypothetical protein Syun_026610 [Stephania yunnanensis]|uniref:DUF985 domain-containing protein n=1 Tax=Stephania yunnanensis TaxID=152371 RepID=A0AAP0ETX5_9MAGN